MSVGVYMWVIFKDYCFTAQNVAKAKVDGCVKALGRCNDIIYIQ